MIIYYFNNAMQTRLTRTCSDHPLPPQSDHHNIWTETRESRLLLQRATSFADQYLNSEFRTRSFRLGGHFRRRHGS